MSQFIDAVKAELLSGRKANFFPMLVVEKEYKSNPGNYSELIEYRIAVKWEQTGHCERTELAPMLDNAVRVLREAVYGDIKQMIIRLERAIYEQDRVAVLSEIRDITREIFG